MAGFIGGCLCGAIRYEVTSDPVRVACCHCDDCRRATGSAFATNVFVKAEDLVVLKGAPHSFQHKVDSGNVLTKEFCADCGSQLFGGSVRSPEIRSVKVGTIDDARFVRPEIEVFTSRKLPFIRLLDDTEHFERMRPQ